VKFSDSPFETQSTAPLGKHSREVLAEAGLTAAQIQSLFDRGVAREIHETLADLL